MVATSTPWRKRSSSLLISLLLTGVSQLLSSSMSPFKMLATACADLGGRAVEKMTSTTVKNMTSATVLKPAAQGTLRQSIWDPLARAAERYAEFSTRRPFTCSLVTAGTVLFSADVTCQTLTRKAGEKHDWKRTLALTVWGTWHYGIPQKFWYMKLEQYFGAGHAMKKMFLDVYVNTPIHLIPSFYFGTGLVRGEKTVAEIYEQLKREWFEACFGSVFFWTPIVVMNFKFVPQHSQILTIVVFSFVHKTWLSWVSNREALKQKRALAAGEAAASLPHKCVEEPAAAKALPLQPMAQHRPRGRAEGPAAVGQDAESDFVPPGMIAA